MSGGSSVERELRNAVEVLPGRLFWVALSAAPPPHASKHYFCIDTELVYWNFFLDFGPLNLGHLFRYCALLNTKLSDPKLKDKVVYHYCSSHPHKRANSAFLISAWSMLYLNRTPEEAFRPFRGVSPAFPTWHDATPSACSFVLTILDTLKGLHKARECMFFDFSKFNIDEYEYYEQVENGDLNWLLEGKFLAFAGPHATRETTPGGYHSLCPDDYVTYFKRRNVGLVIRLNKKYYDARRFTQHGIEHMDLYFLDGSNPPDHLLSRFLEKSEQTNCAIAVHCKAGLGRTGSCIGCYMMKHFKFTAEEVIGWLRIVRPGSIIGPQQQFMKDTQARMWREGELYRARLHSLGPAGVSGKGAAAAIAAGGSSGSELDEGGGGGGASPSSALSKGMSSMSFGADSKSISGGGGEGVPEKESQGDSLRARTEARRLQQSGAVPGGVPTSSRGPGGGSSAAAAESASTGSSIKAGSKGGGVLGGFLSSWK